MKVLPIETAQLDEIGQFLHAHLNRRISAHDWSASLRHPWAAQQPNHGMQLITDDGRRVGVLCAVYSDQIVDGRPERFCNPHSWCVLDEFRHASISLVLSVLKQRDYHFTMFTPNPKVAQVFLGLRFHVLDDDLLYFPNLGAPRFGAGGAFATAEPARIAAALSGAALAEYEAHRDIPWLRFAAFGVPGDACLAIYKTGRWKKLPCALIGHLSDRDAAQRHGDLLRLHLLRRGLPVSRIEARFLAGVPPMAHRAKRLQPKLVATRTLTDAQVRDVYSELMALDI